jgi:hypothetical protein
VAFYVFKKPWMNSPEGDIGNAAIVAAWFSS